VEVDAGATVIVKHSTIDSSAGSGTVTSTFSGARVYNSGDFSHDNSGGEKIITFDTEEFDTDAYHSTSANTSRLTVPTTGY
jgi:hypothetical protein